MKKKGFTLIELLGVIVILALLAILVFPSIINFIKKSSEDSDELTLELIYNATDTYIKNNKDKFYTVDGNKYIIQLTDLVSENLLISPVKLSEEDITNTKCIQVTYNNGYKYELKNSGTCEETTYDNGKVVYFNVSEGKGCKESDYTESQSAIGVKSGCMKFYMFNDDGGETINLLLDHNTTSNSHWTNSSTSTNVEGPIDVLTHLYEDTKNWKGTITPKNYTMDQSSQASGAKYTIPYKIDGYKARLITAQEVAQITETDEWQEITSIENFYFDSNENTANLNCTTGDTTGCKYGWLYDRTNPACKDYGCYNNSEKSVLGYLTASSKADTNFMVWYVDYTGKLDRCHVIYCSSSIIGVRPVIEVYKSNL